MHDELFDPTTMLRVSPQPTISETADAINQSAKRALGIVNLCQSEYHAIDANHLPLDTVKRGPVLVA